MAQHISSIKTAGIRQVSKEQFYKELVWGDLIFCQGNYAVSRGIEAITGSPFSHVLGIWLPANSTEWLTDESTDSKGVHVGRLADYVDNYDGDLVLCRRTISETNRQKGLNYFYSMLDDKYDYKQEAKMVAHKLCKLFPVDSTKGEYFCSGWQYAKSIVEGYPLQPSATLGAMPTPEENFTDPSVVAVCCLVKD